MIAAPLGEPSDRPWRLGDALAFVVLGISCAAYVFVHQLASLTFPVPWGDEAAFIWQALAVADFNSLFAPQLNPDRSILWVPPGYVILLGTLLKCLGSPLTVARGLSTVLILATVGLVALQGRRAGTGGPSCIMCSAFLLSAQFVVAGNVARMEALVLAIGTTGFFLLATPHTCYALALLGLTPLVHPNGAYFLAGAVLFLVVRGRRTSPRLTTFDAVILTASILAWCAYGFYVLSEWSSFRHDMWWQWLHKIDPALAPRIWTIPNGVILGFLIICGFVGWLKEDVTYLLPVSFAFSAWAITNSARSMWYGIYDAFSALLLSMLLVQTAVRLAEKWHSRAARQAAAWIATLSCLAMSYRTGLIENPINYVSDVTWGGMRIQRETPYLTAEDLKAIGAILGSLKSERGLTLVEMYPWADALFFHALDGKVVRFVVPIMHPLFTRPFARDRGAGLSATRVPDVFVIHVSQSQPAWLLPQFGDQFVRAGLSSSDARYVVYTRQGTEKWYVRRVSAAAGGRSADDQFR